VARGPERKNEVRPISLQKQLYWLKKIDLVRTRGRKKHHFYASKEKVNGRGPSSGKPKKRLTLKKEKARAARLKEILGERKKRKYPPQAGGKEGKKKKALHKTKGSTAGQKTSNFILFELYRKRKLRWRSKKSHQGKWKKKEEKIADRESKMLFGSKRGVRQ